MNGFFKSYLITQYTYLVKTNIDIEHTTFFMKGSAKVR